MLIAMTDMAENVDLILEGKKNPRFGANKGGAKKIKRSTKREAIAIEANRIGRFLNSKGWRSVEVPHRIEYANSALYLGISDCQCNCSFQLTARGRIVASIYLQTNIPQSKPFV
ncbi:hypothetical protein IEQ34_002549 [Dendrobium chrysotoxum]|uniref:Uncharacterized protein n=1 Tax=Dendrobium chrysotoxum TaxID=161865 RepID=A0AAV7HK68_DENCH|nr:hypothetical protein IEQ34_002549 [Dendrobium chrysotoxum]